MDQLNRRKANKKYRKISCLETKEIQYYRGIRIKADTGLHEQIAELVFRSVKDGASILDFGCGEGALSQRLKDRGGEEA